jgi:hypothetical protein
MAADKTPGRKALEQKQRAQRMDKLERKGRQPEHFKGGTPAEKAKDARHAEGMYRAVDKATKEKK